MATADSLDPAGFIAAHLPLVPVPGIPGIRVHKAQPTSGLSRLVDGGGDGDGRGDGGSAPYWAYHWGGGLALARYLLDHPDRVAGRRVLDLGAGSGLVAIAAAKAGAGHVLAAEIDPLATAAIVLNLAANGVTATIVAHDLTAGPSPPVDIVLVGDLFYDRDLATRVTAFLDRCLAAGIAILIGDPWRTWLPRARLTVLAEYSVSETGGSVARPAAVFAFRR